MPHLVIEHTSKTTAKMGEVCDAIFDTACKLEEFPDPKTIKVRSQLCENHRGGKGDDFAHVTIRILEGRSDTAKSNISNAIFDVVVGLLPETQNVTCEVVDLHAASYLKR